MTDYINKFRTFFDKFEKQYYKTDEDGKQILFELANNYVEENRDFIMFYPPSNYWEKVNNYKINDFYSEYNNKNINLYFHIPFCSTKCTYCDFSIVVGNKYRDLNQKLYIDKLEEEIDEFLGIDFNFEIDTIFIGGGTPSYLSENILELFLSIIDNKLKKYFNKEVEITFEGNPDSFSEGKIKILKKYGINRVSLGVQTFSDNILKKVNRTYVNEEIYDVFNLFKKYGIININFDMLYGCFSGYDKNILEEDLYNLAKLKPSHITYYPLFFYEDSTLVKQGNKNIDINTNYKYYDYIKYKLKDLGYNQYGNEYFSLGENNKHKYQNNYLSGELLLGFGLGSMSFNGNEMIQRNFSFKDYMMGGDNIFKNYYFDDIALDRKILVLSTRLSNISLTKIKYFDGIKSKFLLGIELGLIENNFDQMILTSKGKKYRELLEHLFI